MPYIKQEDRKVYDEKLDDLCVALEKKGYDEGHVTYVLYTIVTRWFKNIPKYKSIARIRGVLLGTISEFDRCIAAPYEDEKIKENGDVVLDYVYEEWDDTLEPVNIEDLPTDEPCVCKGGQYDCGGS